MHRILIAAALCCCQFRFGLNGWTGGRLAFRAPPDGKPNLTAPAPRTPDGKPDFSGMWQPETNPFRFDVIQDLKDEAIFRRLRRLRFWNVVADFRKDDPVTNCLPAGPAEMLSATYRIMQSPGVVALLYESGTGRYRQIYMDGRKLRKIRTRVG
jgi:hypothetical protein